MKELVRRAAIQAAVYFCIGALMMVGLRTVEWIVPQPAQYVYVCLASDSWKLGPCKRLDDLIKKGGAA